MGKEQLEGNVKGRKRVHVYVGRDKVRFERHVKGERASGCVRSCGYDWHLVIFIFLFSFLYLLCNFLYCERLAPLISLFLACPSALGFDRCEAEEPLLVRPSSDCNMYDKGCCYSTEMLDVNFGGIGVAVHKDMYSAFLEVAKIMAKHRYEIRSAGGFCCRCIREGDGCSSSRSNHAYGVAIDINPSVSSDSQNLARSRNSDRQQREK